MSKLECTEDSLVARFDNDVYAFDFVTVLFARRIFIIPLLLVIRVRSTAKTLTPEQAFAELGYPRDILVYII